MGKHRWGVILDAGSSGTRAHIYKWKHSDSAVEHASKSELQSLPKLKTHKKWTKKIHPGVSTFGENPQDVGEDHLKELFDHALSIIPDDQVEDTPLFLMATAGMRLLPPMQQKALKREICSYAQKHTKFSLPDCDLHIQVISGETEGLYGWIAANYLVGGFDAPEDHQHGKGHHTYGFLDMGGASAQIAFAPNKTEAIKHANDLKLLRMRTLDGKPSEHKVFVASWLGFGVNQARERYTESLIDSVGSSHMEIPDPCLPIGVTTYTTGEVVDIKTAEKSKKPYLVGQGQFAECLRKTYPLLNKEAECKDDPCLINGQHVPAIDFDVNHFIGVSEYWHTTHEFFALSHKSDNYDFTEYQKRVKEFCNQDWEDIEEGVAAKKWGKKVDERTAREVCFKASWLINILHEGIGIPRFGIETGYKGGSNATTTMEVMARAKSAGYLDPFQAVDKIGDTEVSWTLGKMVLYASGQVKPSGKDLPVGFGSNVGTGIPSDFERAGSVYTPWTGKDDDDDWDDQLEEYASKPSTGLFALLIIVIILAYFFRKRERRTRYLGKIMSYTRSHRRPGSPRRKPGFFGAVTDKIFGRKGSMGHYERVLEEGDGINDFELRSDIESDDEHVHDSESSESSHQARGSASGLATPKLNVVNSMGDFDTVPLGGYGNHHGNHSNLSLNSGLGLGLGLQGVNAMDRSGLVVRTESRERLTLNGLGLGSGRSRSRNGSPVRNGRSPLMTAVTED